MLGNHFRMIIWLWEKGRILRYSSYPNLEMSWRHNESSLRGFKNIFSHTKCCLLLSIAGDSELQDNPANPEEATQFCEWWDLLQVQFLYHTWVEAVLGSPASLLLCPWSKSTKVTPSLLSAMSSDTGQCNTRKGIWVKELSLSLLLDVNKEACCSDCCWQPFPCKATRLRMNQCCDWQLGEVGGNATLTTGSSY